jgi:hypothetical protein
MNNRSMLTWIECLAENERLRIQIAAMPTEIARQTEALRDDRDHILAALRDSHRSDVSRTDCQFCDGSGSITHEVDDNFPSKPNGFDESTSFETVECGDCRGSRKEW